MRAAILALTAAITVLGTAPAATLAFTHDVSGLTINLPAALPGPHACTLKIAGLKLPPASALNSRDGNPPSP